MQEPERQPAAGGYPPVKDSATAEQIGELKALLETAADLGALIKGKLDGLPVRIDADGGES